MAAPIIHGPAISTYVRTVRLVCEEKGAPYQLAEVDIMQGGNKTPEHLARHPFGKVPAFEHDGFQLYETSAITRYLDAVLPGPSLTPADPKGAARMQQAIAIVDSYAYGSMISAIVIQRVVMPMVGGIADETMIAAALPTAEISLAAFEALLDGNRFLAGDSLSLADLHLTPVMAYFSATPEGQARLPRHPNLARWWGAMSSRPSMARTQPHLG
ncbi:MAG: glutathione S-transferase family protein [Geminicoccaceae bacterium]